MDMGRRGFMQLIAVVFGAFPKISRAALYRYGGKQRQLNFFVSGSRFLDPISNLKVGDRVEIREGFFESAPCYSVVASGDQKLGYVPRQLTSVLEKLHVADARLAAVDLDGVPWKRYKVTISAEGADR
jgi:hypothetical protein